MADTVEACREIYVKKKSVFVPFGYRKWTIILGGESLHIRNHKNKDVLSVDAQDAKSKIWFQSIWSHYNTVFKGRSKTVRLLLNNKDSDTLRTWISEQVATQGEEAKGAETVELEELRHCTEPSGELEELGREEMQVIVEAEASTDIEKLSALAREGPYAMRRPALHALGRIAMVIGTPRSSHARKELTRLIASQIDTMLSAVAREGPHAMRRPALRQDVALILCTLKKKGPNDQWLQREIYTGEHIDPKTWLRYPDSKPRIRAGRRLSMSEAIEAVHAFWRIPSELPAADVHYGYTGRAEEKHAQIRSNRLEIFCKGRKENTNVDGSGEPCEWCLSVTRLAQNDFLVLVEHARYRG